MHRKILERPALSDKKHLVGPPPPNCRTGRWLLRIVPMAAVHHRLKSALGARQVAPEDVLAGVDVRLFGETREGLLDSREVDGHRA